MLKLNSDPVSLLLENLQLGSALGPKRRPGLRASAARRHSVRVCEGSGGAPAMPAVTVSSQLPGARSASAASGARSSTARARRSMAAVSLVGVQDLREAQ